MAAHKWRPEVAVLLQIKWRRRLYRTICPSVHLLASHFGHFCGAIEQFGLCFAQNLSQVVQPCERESEWEATLILCLAGAALAIAVLFMAHN